MKKKITKILSILILLLTIVSIIITYLDKNNFDIDNTIEISLTILSLIFGFSLTSITIFFQNEKFNKILNYQENDNNKTELDIFLERNRNFFYINIFLIFVNTLFIFITNFTNIFNIIIFFFVIFSNFYMLYKLYNFVNILIIDYKNVYSREGKKILRLIKKDEYNENI